MRAEISKSPGKARGFSADAIRVARTPRAKTVFRHIMETRDYDGACTRVALREPLKGVICFSLPKTLVSGLRAAAKQAITRHGLHSWLSKEGRPEKSSYESLSLTYNPDLRDPGVDDVHQSTLGTSVNLKSEFFYGKVHRFSELKNTYFDTYGFRLLTPAAKIGELGKFLSECKLSLVRSRLSVLYGDDEKDINTESGWHRDEPVFENLRINIPLVSHRNYRLQVENVRDVPAEDSTTATTHYLKSGFAYTFDTHRPHRVFPIGLCRVMRVHLVLGFAPWFRYDPSAGAWSPNEHYGRVHPFDILRGGGLHPALRTG
jgi:hypothetical protein